MLAVGLASGGSAATAQEAGRDYNIHMYKINTSQGSLRLSFGPGGCRHATPAAGNGVSIINWQGKTVPVVCINNDGWKQVVMECAYQGGRPPLYQPIPPDAYVEIAVKVGPSPDTTIAYYTLQPDCVPNEENAIFGSSTE